MATEAQVAAFEGGQLRILASGGNGREAVLALPLNYLLATMVRVPAESDPVEFSKPIIQSLSPFPDEQLTVSCETVREEETGKVVIAAAFPDGAAEDVAEALDAAKLNVVRIDALALGQLRGIWTTLGGGDGRRLILIKGPDCIDMIVLDGDQPSAIRAITDVADIRREVMLLLLEAEDFGGAKLLKEIVVVKGEEADKGDESEKGVDTVATLASMAPVREITVGSDAALVGVAERSEDAGALNALPESWRTVLEETRFKAKMAKYLAIAGGIWLLVMGTLFGVPIAYGFLTDHQKALSRQHDRQYQAVKEMKAKVDVIQKYSDHTRGALEIMKAISDRLPPGITLLSWNYKREDGVTVRGEADNAEEVYKLKDEMDALSAGDGEDAERIFGKVELRGPNAAKSRNMYTFDLNCEYVKEEVE